MRAINLIYLNNKFDKEKVFHINFEQICHDTNMLDPLIDLNSINMVTITDGNMNGERVIFSEKMNPSHLIEENKRLKKLVDYYERLEYLI